MNPTTPFNSFFKWGDKDFPQYDGPPSILEHDSIDDLNREMKKRMRNNTHIAGPSTQTIVENIETDIEKIFREQFPEEYKLYKSSILQQGEDRHNKFRIKH